MKKFLLLGVIALSGFTMNAQVIESDNYNSYTLGDVGTNFAFGTPGQGGIYLNGGAAPDYQIVNVDADHGNSFWVMSGATGVAASNRQAVKLGFSAAWAARTAGNDIVRATFDIYTGTSTGNSLIGFNITSATGGLVGIRYDSNTKLFTGMASLTNTSTSVVGFYNITGISAVPYPANTWVKVGFTYDKVNGAITYTINGVTANLAIGGYTITKNLDGTQFNMITTANAANTASTTAAFDNYVVDAVNAAALGVTTVGQIENDLNVSIYPNPTSDYINIKSNVKVSSVTIVDMTGKNVASKKAVNNRVDVRNLPVGNYIINLITENGVQSKKFIKK